MSKGIRLSPRHGVNAAIPKCFYCLEDKNEIVLPGYLRGDQESPHGAVWNMEPCDKCRTYMEQGIILISAKNGTDPKNPYRTGGWCVVRAEAFIPILQAPMKELVEKMRFSFLEDETWEALGLPMDGILEGRAKQG